MKTFKEILDEYCKSITGSSCSCFDESEISMLDTCAKIYGRQCAEQALKDAAENVKLMIESNNGIKRNRLVITREDILNTVIQTP